MSRENSVVRKTGSQTSLKKDSEKQAEKKRLIQEETVEQGSVSGCSLVRFHVVNWGLQNSMKILVIGFTSKFKNRKLNFCSSV